MLERTSLLSLTLERRRGGEETEVMVGGGVEMLEQAKGAITI